LGALYLSTLAGDKIMDLSFVLGFAFPIIVLSFCLGYWSCKLTNNFSEKRLFNSKVKRAVSISLVVIVVWLSMPIYADLLPTKKTIEFEQPYFDSTEVLVHYGEREQDFFWTQTTIGELKENQKVSLKINDENIFTIHTDGRQIIIDAVLFAGYENRVVPEYTTIGSVENFSIEISGYFDTGPSAVGRSFNQKPQSVIVKNKALADPVIIKNNGITNNPGNKWRINHSEIGFEVLNECNIPVLVLEYKKPFEITISGLFLTSLGILKVDNSEDVIFKLADCPFELGTYKVDRIRPHTVFDFFTSDRTYILSDQGRME
jgi:hypothetical protein